MAESDYYLVLLYDARENTYTTVSHNLALSKAGTEVSRFRKERIPAFYQKQQRRHRSQDLADCRSVRDRR